MPGLLLKLLLLLLYLILLFVVFRLCELAVWYEAGFVASQLVDPVSLSVRKLKNLLDARGVNYEGMVEKKELSQLVDQSGDVLDGELMMAEEEEDEESEDDSTLFSSRGHFYEEVEDKKDSVWLIQVKPLGHHSLLYPASWKAIKKKVSHFGIRTGTFDCNSDSSFCSMKQWIKPSILLAMPQGETYKDHVTMFHYYKPGQPAYILDWINNHLKTKITILSNQDAAQEWMETAKSRPNHFPIRVAYYSNIDQLPLFYSLLSVKFTGRIKFAFISTDPMEFSTTKRSQKDILKVPSILITTPEDTLHYSKRPGEYLSYARLVLYLKTLSPEVNDVFILSLLFVNVLCVFEFFVTQGGILKRSFYLTWTIGKSNVSFLAFWLPFLGMLQLSVLEPFWNFANKILRKFLISNIMCYIRSDVLVYSNNTKFLLLTFLTYCCIIGLIEKYRKRTTTVQQESNTAWLRGVLRHYYMFLIRPSSNLYRPRLNRAHMEEGLDLLIDRLAVPDFWLHPVIPTDYISNLQTWKYCSSKEKDYEQSFDKLCGSCDSQEQVNAECSCVETSKKSSGDDSLALCDVPDSGVQDEDLLPSMRVSEIQQVDDVDQQLNADTCETINSQEGHDFQSNAANKENELPNNLVSTDCAICLEVYCHGVVICGLPCGHSYHHGCIVTWLRGGNHRCPTCRWPAYKAKGCKLLKYQE
ncbi:E3 ubiquitin-protein ligase RNF103-like [Anneissia japonica]|uniref:E3 ubiquitin-protein ligase RNF103-like n=1 Tax=Anneissia japonica TaxID=1529436 RepID=UPI0014256364|nr:E3 ubiquitin-protein ligase RNF103-like [Anneissia japonica]